MTCWKGSPKKGKKEEMPFPWRVFITSLFICAGGSFQFGYQLTIANPTEWIFRQFINESCFDHYGRFMDENAYRLIWSTILNLQLIGSALGTLPLVRLSETLGRRKTFFVSSSFTMAGLLLQAFSKAASSFELLALGRFVSGFGGGIVLGLEPMYLNEISPIERRGFIGSMTGIFVELGFIIGGVMAMPNTLGTMTLWPFMFVVEIIPTLALFVVLPFLHESPRYLLARDKVEECKRSLIFFGRRDVDASVREIESEIECQTERVTFKELYQKPYLRRATYLGTLVALTTAISGITAIDYFSTSVFIDVGLTNTSAQYASLGVFLQCFISAVLGGFITDKVGRRLLLLVTITALILINVIMMILSIVYDLYGSKWAGYTSVAACIVFAFVFGVGPSVLQWTVAAELVPQNARSTVQQVAMTIQKIVAIILGMAFYPLQGAIGAYSFLIFIVPLSLCLVIFVWKFPETKNRTVVDILHTLGYSEGAEKPELSLKKTLPELGKEENV